MKGKIKPGLLLKVFCAGAALGGFAVVIYYLFVR